MKVIYLIQGSLVDLHFIQDYIPEDQFTITLNYDVDPKKSVPKSNIHIYFPNSTWASGRNLLLERARGLGIDFEYYIFLDADLRVIKSGFSEFEELLKTYRPKLGLPLGDQVKNTYRYLPNASVQSQFSFDQILQAYRSDVIEDGICVPYITDFDSDSWWYSCEINSYLTVFYCQDDIIQFNDFEIQNSRHDGPELNAEGQSNYKAGTNALGLSKCRDLIQSKFEDPRFVLGTLFHPKFLPKLIHYPTVRQLVRREFEEDSGIEVGRFLRAIVKSAQVFLYRVLFNRYDLENRIIVERSKKGS